MKQIRLLTGMLFVVLMSGCASLPESFTASELPFNDDVFTQYNEYTPESADEIFKLVPISVPFKSIKYNIISSNFTAKIFC